MRKKMIVIALALATVALQANTTPAASKGKGAESVILISPRGDVTFPHGRHQKIFVNCQPCHELFPKRAKVIREMRAEGKLKGQEVMNMCKKCHEARLAQGERGGPTECKGCHSK